MKSIALMGVECTGKTTTAMLVAGRLRTRGVLAECCYEQGKSLPFPTSMMDTSREAWEWRVAHKIEEELRLRLQPSIDFLVCDRTPLDFVLYARAKNLELSAYLTRYTETWLERYDRVFYFPMKNTVYREDGFRAKGVSNTWRTYVDKLMGLHTDNKNVITVPVEKTYKERAEFVYHTVLAEFFGETRPLRAYAQVEGWLRQRGWRVVEVRPQGSNSIERFHAPTDNDDIDMMVIVDGDANYAIEVRADFMAHKDHLENVVQADLDVLVTPKGLEAHEV